MKMETYIAFSRFSCTVNIVLLERLPCSTDSVNKIPRWCLNSTDRANKLIIPWWCWVLFFFLAFAGFIPYLPSGKPFFQRIDKSVSIGNVIPVVDEAFQRKSNICWKAMEQLPGLLKPVFQADALGRTL